MQQSDEDLFLDPIKKSVKDLTIHIYVAVGYMGDEVVRMTFTNNS